MPKIPISKRLLTCAALVDKGSMVADIGADHGYLGIYLVSENIAGHVYASDLREKPIRTAIVNAQKYHVSEQMDFFCAPGLTAVPKEQIQTIICAGMGADTIIEILSEAPWVFQKGYTLILQPQSSGQDLRRYLGENGYSIMREILLKDGKFLYTVLKAEYTGECNTLTPGEQFVSPALQKEESNWYPIYLKRLINSIEDTLQGLKTGGIDNEKASYYSAALNEIKEYLRAYENRS